MTHTIALAVPHTPWVPSRVATLERLLEQLDATSCEPPWYLGCRIFGEKAPNAVWSEQLWRWGLQTGATHLLQLQDDVEVAPGFWLALRAMIEAVPDQIVCLEALHPASRQLFDEGHAWYTTSDGLVGRAWVLPRPVLEEFLVWRASQVDPKALEGDRPPVPEDTLIALFALCTGRRVWHPMPGVVDHDLEAPSTQGNAGDPHRRSRVLWRDLGEMGWSVPFLSEEDWWRAGAARAPFLGRLWGDALVGLASTYVRGFEGDRRALVVLEDGRAELRRLAIVASLKRPPPERRVLICTPTKEHPHPQYHTSVWRLARSPLIDFDLGFELYATRLWQQDVVRVRSRFVRAFLETPCTDLLFLDADQAFDPRVIEGMVASGREIVLAPYPRRTGIDLRKVDPTAAKPDADAYAYTLRLEAGQGAIHPDGTTEIAGGPLGCCLIRRSALERMVEHYGNWRVFGDEDAHALADETIALAMSDDRPVAGLQDDMRRQIVLALKEAYRRGREDQANALEFLDRDKTLGPAARKTVALFQLLLREQELLSEDLSFCDRARASGIPVHAYFGPGSPIDHVGEYVFKGHIEAFGIQRVEGA